MKPKMSSNSNFLKFSLLKVTILAIIIHFGNTSFAQNYDWDLDKHRKREIEKKRNLDSLLVHLKNNWQLSISYGQLIFNNSSKSKENSLLELPKNMNAWNLSFARYLSEHFTVKSNLGIVIKTVKPPRPDIFSIINGANVEIEGGGIILVPIRVGVDYFFLKQRFRPYAGIGVGTVLARNKYVEASGNISNGINRDEYEFNGNAIFGELSSGFYYRTGKKTQLGLNCDYLRSKDFGKNIGGYKALNGIKISVFWSFVF